MANPLFDEIYAVGDSLSDSGGIYDLSSHALALAAAFGVKLPALPPIPVSPPYAKKFSNGPVLPEITADLLGARLDNSRSAAPTRSARRRSSMPPARRYEPWCRRPSSARISSPGSWPRSTP